MIFSKIVRKDSVSNRILSEDRRRKALEKLVTKNFQKNFKKVLTSLARLIKN